MPDSLTKVGTHSDVIGSTAVCEARIFAQLLHQAARAYGDDTFMTLVQEGLTEDTLTFTALERESAQLARGLLARGVGKGTRIGFMVGNGPDFARWLAAITRIGAVAIPMSTLLKGAELLRVLRQSDISGLIVQRELLGKDLLSRLMETLPDLAVKNSADLRLHQLPFLRWILSSGDSLPRAIRSTAWLTEAVGTIDEALLAAAEQEVYPSDQMVEIYTSGSMALPKGVRHGHGPVVMRAKYLQKKLAISKDQQLIATMPMFWVGGLMMSLLPALVAGAHVICKERTVVDSRYAMGSVQAEGDEIVYPEGATLWALGMTETLGPYSYGDVARVPGFPLCAPLDHIAEGFEVRVCDENDVPVMDGVSGEIQVRGYALTYGLHKLDAAEFFSADGFYRTGDLGVVEGSRIHFLGRAGDIIKTGNANVSPAEVEEELQRLPGVHSAYVVGIPDREKGQVVVAAVVPREGEEVDTTVMISAMKQQLSSFKVPKAIYLIDRNDVPMLASNKVARREIARCLAEVHSEKSHH